MPRFNGVFSYLIEVLLHLLRNYLVLALVYPLLTIPFLISAAASGSLHEAVVGWTATLGGGWLFLWGCVHLFTFVLFRSYFLPKFPYAPALLTFALAAFFGSMLLAVAWSFDEFAVTWSRAKLIAFPEWVAANVDVLWRWFSLAFGVAIGGGLFGILLHVVSGSAAMTWGIGKWIGWLIVGRAVYDDFVEKEVARLRKDYEAYVDEIRR